MKGPRFPRGLRRIEGEYRRDCKIRIIGVRVENEKKRSEWLEAGS